VGMKKIEEIRIASFICHVFVKLATVEEMLDVKHLKKCVNGICRGIKMKKLGRIQVDKLPAPNSPEVHAFSLNQPLSHRPFIITRPLKTSVMFLQPAIPLMSLDTWPESKILALVIHSCKRITKKQVRLSLKKFFPGCRIVGDVDIYKKVVKSKK
jgi:hypothetical protein